MSQPYHKIDLKDWKKKRTAVFTTGDGLQLTYRRAGLADLAAQGTIPLPLLAKLERLKDGKAEAILGEIDELAKAINAVVCAVVKSPLVLSVEQANAIVDQVYQTYVGTPVTREQVAVWLDEAGAGETVPQLAGPERAALVERYTSAVLVTDIDFEDRMQLFNLLAGEGQAMATFPEPAA